MMVAVAPKQNLSRHGIGASEIAAIVGMNPYASPWDVWLRKTGQAPDIEETAPMEWGMRLEPAIRQKYVDDTGLMVYVPPESLFSRDREWARATPDGIAVTAGTMVKLDQLPDSKRHHLLQCKNVGYWPAKDWHGMPPVHVQLQVQWEMFVTGLARTDVAALLAGNEFLVFTIMRDERTISDLVTIAEAFWKKVETRKEPAIDDSDACREHFERRLKREPIEVIADSDAEQLFEEWRALKMRQKLDDKREKTIRNEVRKLMAESGATIVKSALGDAKLTIPSTPEPTSVVNWKHVAELLGSTKCTPAEFAELVTTSTVTLTPEAKAPVLYAPRNWSRE